jgi:hypothetical protein
MNFQETLKKLGITQNRPDQLTNDDKMAVDTYLAKNIGRVNVGHNLFGISAEDVAQLMRKKLGDISRPKPQPLPPSYFESEGGFEEY